MNARRVWGAFAVGTLISSSIAFAAARGDIDNMTFGDGHIHRYVALNLATPPDEIDPAIVQSGTSLRYGRIGWPIVLWATSGGRASIINVTQPLATAAAGGAAFAALTALMPAVPVRRRLMLFAVPAVAIGISGGFAEPAALALSLWGLYAFRDRSPLVAAPLFAAAILTKEIALTIVVGGALWALRRWRVRTGETALILFAAATPVAGWYLFVRARFGHIPVFDPYLQGDRGVDIPGKGLIFSLTDPASAGSWLTAAFHVAIALAVLPFVRRSVYAMCAAFASLPLLITTPFTPWRFIGDGFRTSILIEVFAFITILDTLTRREAERRIDDDSPTPTEAQPSIGSATKPRR